MTRVIGLTGGIGSGKSTVARQLQQLGATVVDADVVTRELQAPGTPVLAEIADAFGPQVLAPDGSLDREALAAIVFRDAKARERLNRIVHPAVGVELARRIEAARNGGVPLVVVDVPLLLETGMARGFDAVVVVYAHEEQQIDRQVARSGTSRDEALRRVRAQLPLEEKKERADFVIDNTGSREDTERQVRELYARLTGRD